jgi:hypothetical protein
MCVQCVSNTTCTSCAPSLYLLNGNCSYFCSYSYNGACMNSCPGNTFSQTGKNNQNYCIPCSSNCATCGTTSTLCFSCNPNYTLSSTNTCVVNCPTGNDCTCNAPFYTLNDSQTCVSDCGPGYFTSAGSNICTPCGQPIENCVLC